MNLSRRAVFALLLLPPPARAAAPSDEIAALMARLAAVAERRADFREERTLAALTEPLVSTGRLRYRRPDYLEKDTLWPQRERTVIDGSRLIIADPASNDPPHVIPLDADPGLRTFADALRAPLAGDLATLRRSFDLEFSQSQPGDRMGPNSPDLHPLPLAGEGRGEGGGSNKTELAARLSTLTQPSPASGRGLSEPNAWTLRLTPRDQAARKFVSTIRIGGTGDWIGSLAIESANGDRSTMQITPA